MRLTALLLVLMAACGDADERPVTNDAGSADIATDVVVDVSTDVTADSGAFRLRDALIPCTQVPGSCPDGN